MAEGQRRVVASVDEAAEQAGLLPGMTVTHAQSLVAGLTVIDATPEDDDAGLVRLALWCTAYAPLVTPDPPEGVFIDIAGAAHLFQGEAALIGDLRRRLKVAGFAARAAVADTPGCAWAMARFTEETIAAPGRTSEAIASLPVASLRLDPEIVEALHDVGIERVAQLASKPRASIQLRFGSAALLRFDQALGSAHEALVSLIPPEVPRCELKFAEPVGDPDDLKRIVGHLSERLCRELEARRIGARRLDLTFTRVDNIKQAVRIGLSRPNRDAAHLAKLLAERLVLVDPGFGIETAMLMASWVEALTERQTLGRHVAEDGAEADLGPLVDALGTRLGEQRIYRAAPVESEMPERAVRKIPALAPSTGLVWPEHLPRPARLLSPPEPVVALAEIPDHPPRAFIWRKIRHLVSRSDGPERINGEWWVSDAEMNLTRDYYRVETEDGRRYWLFRDAPAEQGGRWWLHGMGDA
jgi:protein ImuB